MIDILIPVLGRPHRPQALTDNISNATTVPHRIWLLISPEEIDVYLYSTANPHTVILKINCGHDNQYPRKINEGYRLSDQMSAVHFPYVFNASDDLEFTPGWAEAALAEMAKNYGNTATNVVATNDRANSQVKKGLFGTHCLIRRSYIDEHGGSLDGPGTVFSEAYDHNFVDRELCHLAQHRGVYAYAKNSVVRHRHPLHDSHVRMDATYTKGLKNFHADQLLFFKRAAGWDYEGLNPQERRVARNRLAKR
jgi:hypothetical protein